MLNDNLLHCCTNNIQFTINIKIEFDVVYVQQKQKQQHTHTQRNKHCQQIGFCHTRKNNAEILFMGRIAKKVYDKIRSDIHVLAWRKKNGLNGICYENHRQFDGFHLRILRIPGNNDNGWVRMVSEIFPIPRTQSHFMAQTFANNVTSNALHN